MKLTVRPIRKGNGGHEHDITRRKVRDVYHKVPTWKQRAQTDERFVSRVDCRPAAPLPTITANSLQWRQTDDDDRSGI